MNGLFCAGIPGEARIVFKPFFGWGDVVVHGIEKGVTYRAAYFNPVTGEETDLGVAVPDENGTWAAPGVTAFQDWVAVLVRAG